MHYRGAGLTDPVFYLYPPACPMNPTELLAHCRAQQQLDTSADARVSLVLRGSFGKGTKRLCPGGPVGEVVNERLDGTVLVFFKAQEVITFLEQGLKKS